jgi:acetyl-CoA carboxylase biotin carboxyl carrier protein
MTSLSDADLQEIIRLLDDSDYNEVEIETDRFRLVLQRAEGGAGGWTQQRHTGAAPNILETKAAVDADSGPRPTSAGEFEETEPGVAELTAPLVGTFYRAPRPGAEPFVETGAQVRADTVVAIIEVMKLMYSVAAGVDGEVVEISAENGKLVERGQRLMLIRTADESSQAGSRP